MVPAANPAKLSTACERCSQLTIIEALAVGGAEVYRNTELNPDKRIYPGEDTLL